MPREVLPNIIFSELAKNQKIKYVMASRKNRCAITNHKNSGSAIRVRYLSFLVPDTFYSHYLLKNEAYELLKYYTGKDFGDDFEKWEQWVDEHPRSIQSQDLSNLDTPLLKKRRERRSDAK